MFDDEDREGGEYVVIGKQQYDLSFIDTPHA